LRERADDRLARLFVETSSLSLTLTWEGAKTSKRFKRRLLRPKENLLHTTRKQLYWHQELLGTYLFLDFTFFIYRQAIKLCGISCGAKRKRDALRANAECSVFSCGAHRKPLTWKNMLAKHDVFGKICIPSPTQNHSLKFKRILTKSINFETQ